jgi:membrane protein YqaA with SNARE-associated domain
MSDPLLVLGLFANAFVSATLLPGASEAMLAALVAARRIDPWLLVAAATLGNTLGSVASWACGRFLLRFRDRRWFPASASGLERASRLFQRRGRAVLLLAWLPVIGDALVVAAGLLAVPLRVFVPLVALGKGARYALVAAGTLGLLPA